MRRRNYSAMGDAKLYRVYWELRNGLAADRKPRIINKIWLDSAFGDTAYKICMSAGSRNPNEDCEIIERLAKAKGMQLWGPPYGSELKQRALADQPSTRELRLAEGVSEMELDKIIDEYNAENAQPESDVIEI